MGKGDQKTRRGKLFSGSYGVRRPRKKSRGFSVVSTTKKSEAKPLKEDVQKPEVSASPPKAEAVDKEETKAPKKPATARKKTEDTDATKATDSESVKKDKKEDNPEK